MKKAFLLAATIITLSGCVMNGPRFATPIQMYEGATKPDNEVASVMAYERSMNPQNFLERYWLAKVIAVDGVAFKDLGWETAKIQVLPGKHVLTMTCQALMLPLHTEQVNVSLSAGRVWYPWAEVPLRNGRPFDDGACKPYIRTTAPALGWSGEIQPK